jgi:hypothetical protein
MGLYGLLAYGARVLRWLPPWFFPGSQNRAIIMPYSARRLCRKRSGTRFPPPTGSAHSRRMSSGSLATPSMFANHLTGRRRPPSKAVNAGSGGVSTRDSRGYLANCSFTSGKPGPARVVAITPAALGGGQVVEVPANAHAEGDHRLPAPLLLRLDQVRGTSNPVLVGEQLLRNKAQAVTRQIGKNGLVAVRVKQQAKRGQQPTTTSGAVEQHHLESGRRRRVTVQMDIGAAPGPPLLGRLPPLAHPHAGGQKALVLTPVVDLGIGASFTRSHSW